MSSELKKVQKGIKWDMIILVAICLVFAVIIMSKISNTAEYLSKETSDFEIKLEDTDTINGTKNYYLYVLGEQQYPVDYNVYASLDSEGNTNVKINLILEEIRGILNCLIMEIIFILIWRMLWFIKKGESPYTKKSVVLLQGVSILSMVLALVPCTVEVIGVFVAFQYVEFQVSSINFYVLAIGAVFGILSEIFRYGCVLQEDMNQIA